MSQNHPLENEQNGFDLKTCLAVMFKRKVTIVSVFFLVFTGAILVSLLITPQYESQSTLMIKMGREYLNTSEVGDGRPVLSVNQEAVMNSEIQILTNRDLIRKTITTIGLDKMFPELKDSDPSGRDPLDAAVAAFEKALTVEGVKNRMSSG